MPEATQVSGTAKVSKSGLQNSVSSAQVYLKSRGGKPQKHGRRASRTLREGGLITLTLSTCGREVWAVTGSRPCVSRTPTTLMMLLLVSNHCRQDVTQSQTVFHTPPSPLSHPWESWPRPSGISLTQTPRTLVHKTVLILWRKKRRPPREQMTLERVPERILLPSVLSHPGCPPPHRQPSCPSCCWVLSLWPERVHSLF